MNYFLYTIQQKEEIVPETFVFWLHPMANQFPSFLPGQYVYLKNPTYTHPEEEHPFSIVSSPTEGPTLEFCIKKYGDWTTAFSLLNPGDTIWVSEPLGIFTWDDTIRNAVFLLGGIGIAPVISMLRFIRQTHHKPHITLLYGNRAPETIAFEDELLNLRKALPLKIINVFSHIQDDYPWKGYRGFITKDVIENEIDLTKKSTWFIIGPPIFIEKMLSILTDLQISKNDIKSENVSISPPSEAETI
ncbi:MAG TPA: FAD-dependent oxidoreductase [Candidatus Saccharimonadales bacterium]|nr:FAD-dependent oxidoreductase [Candidatus Saccharimonadales bacterium]